MSFTRGEGGIGKGITRGLSELKSENNFKVPLCRGLGAGTQSFSDFATTIAIASHPTYNKDL